MLTSPAGPLTACLCLAGLTTAFAQEGPTMPMQHTRPLIIGHRGFSAVWPENTLHAITMALDAGADGVEIDVQISRDGHVVLMHDATVDRTTSGTGRVEDLTLAELKALTILDREGVAHTIPTLAEALGAVKGRGVTILDVKREGICQEIADVIAELGMQTEVIVCSWTPANAERVRETMPGVASAAIVSAPDPPEQGFFAQWMAVGVRCLSANMGTVTPAFVRAAHLRALPVFVWTVNDAPTMQRAADMGVDGLLTDDPALALATMFPGAEG